MANLVKCPHVQEKLYMEIRGVVGDAAEDVKEDDLHKMPYLKAVVLKEEMGLDYKIWEDPLAFNLERFLDIEEEVDLTGRKEIKMIPLGAGKRICPAHSLAMLHLQYFVANLVWFCK
ncbi:hypothetical protein PTKIN_Ptkin01aG0398900 [Pterospermum kingtungense]